VKKLKSLWKLFVLQRRMCKKKKLKWMIELLL
jgi:hypothetical protein